MRLYSVQRGIFSWDQVFNTDGYDCYQNAMAERINGILKTEFLLSRPRDLADAVKTVDESVLIYNEEWPHLALKYNTPDSVRRTF
jgi:putative transposase